MKTIAIVSGKASDFCSFVGRIYDKINSEAKSMLVTGSKIVLDSGNDATTYILVQRVRDVRGYRIDGYETILSAYTLPEYDGIMQEIGICSKTDTTA